MDDDRRVRATTVLLIHGGLAEDMDADRFWVRPGIVDALESAGVQVYAPDRNTTPDTWTGAADEMAADLDAPAIVVAGSNGVSAALRLAIDHPALVSRLVLLWPATAGDQTVDAAVPSSARHLLVGGTVRGTTDAELRSINVPVAVMASDPPNRAHQHRTVDRLVDLIPGAVRITERFPESPHPEFAAVLEEFTEVLRAHL